MTRRRRLSPRSAPEPTADVLGRTLELVGLGQERWRLEIYRRWPEAVGAKIAARAAPAAFTRGVLTVRAATPTWQHELMFLRTTILAKLNALLDRPRVLELRVVSGHLPAKKAPVVPVRPVVAHADREAAQQCGTAITDPEVRAAFEALMAQTLAHQRPAPTSPQAKRPPAR